MKQTVVRTFDDGGHSYGQVSNPNDLMHAQDYVHDRISNVVTDFVADASPEIKGFPYSLSSDMGVTVTRAGRVYKNGVTYDLYQDYVLPFDAADDDLPRIDLIIAKLEDEVDAVIDLIPYVQLRTDDEYADGVDPYAPVNVSSPTEKHWRSVVQIKKGTAATEPQAPAVDSNEIPLYLVAIRAGATRIGDSEIIDLRNVGRTVRQMEGSLDTTRQEVTTIESRVHDLETATHLPIDLSQIFGDIQTINEILASLLSQTSPSADIPDIRYARLKSGVTMVDNASSQIRLTPGSASSVPFCDIEIGGRVNFGTAEQVILPQRFLDQTINPRFVTSGTPSGHTQRNVDTTIGSVTPGDTDGTLGFAQKAAELSPLRQWAAMCARDDRYEEMFGGINASGTSALTDWKTYDTLNDTLTPRTITGDVPVGTGGLARMFPYGDGTHVLLICPQGVNNAPATPRCYKVNATTGVSVEITGTRPVGGSFLGDLVHAGKIIIICDNSGIKTWEFDTATDTFTLLSVTGSVPLDVYSSGGPTFGACGSACLLSDNKLLFVGAGVLPFANLGSVRTYVFDRTTLTWVQLTIPRPWNDRGDGETGNLFYQLANVSGKPMITGGYTTLTGTTANRQHWVLSGPSTSGGLLSDLRWEAFTAPTYGLASHSFASLIGVDGLPDGKAVIMGGNRTSVTNNPNIFMSSQAGLIVGTANSVTGISLAPGSTYAKFTVPLYTESFAVNAYRVSLLGNLPTSSYGLRFSMDNGDNWQAITPDTTVTVTDSDNPANRLLEVTLYQTPSDPPVITRIVETLDQNGGVIEDNQVLRFNTPTSGAARGLYLHSNGDVELSTTIEQSTSTKALIAKITPSGTSAPTVKNYINRRRALIKYTGTRASGTTPPFANELAVEARFVNAWVKTVSTGVVYKIADPTITFDSDTITPAGVTTNGDQYTVEIGV